MEGVTWRCGWSGCLHKGRWWRSAYGAIRCVNCQPPASADLIVAEGGEADAPGVRRDCSSSAVDYAGPRTGDRRPRPLWVLRGNCMPEKVVSKEGRRKVEIPPDVTHWCHEGDPEWTPLYRARPSDGVIANPVGGGGAAGRTSDGA